MGKQLERLVDKADRPGPQSSQYALKATTDGAYPDVRNGTIWLSAGDVWKYGKSNDIEDRYSAAALANMGLELEEQTRGTEAQVLAAEKAKLIMYYMTHAQLPPGNKRFK